MKRHKLLRIQIGVFLTITVLFTAYASSAKEHINVSQEIEQKTLKRADQLFRDGDIDGAYLLLEFLTEKGSVEARQKLKLICDEEYIKKNGIKNIKHALRCQAYKKTKSIPGIKWDRLEEPQNIDLEFSGKHIK